jgi:hypothetical protein
MSHQSTRRRPPPIRRDNTQSRRRGATEWGWGGGAPTSQPKGTCSPARRGHRLTSDPSLRTRSLTSSTTRTTATTTTTTTTKTKTTMRTTTTTTTDNEDDEDEDDGQRGRRNPRLQPTGCTVRMTTTTTAVWRVGGAPCRRNTDGPRHLTCARRLRRRVCTPISANPCTRTNGYGYGQGYGSLRPDPDKNPYPLCGCGFCAGTGAGREISTRGLPVLCTKCASSIGGLVICETLHG